MEATGKSLLEHLREVRLSGVGKGGVTFNEDGRGMSKGQAPENLSLLSTIALNIARQSGFGSMKDAVMAFTNKIGLMASVQSNQYCR